MLNLFAKIGRVILDSDPGSQVWHCSRREYLGIRFPSRTFRSHIALCKRRTDAEILDHAFCERYQDDGSATAAFFYYFTFFNVGNKITSFIDVVLVNNMTRRSMPMPTPTAGGIPYSRAVT